MAAASVTCQGRGNRKDGELIPHPSQNITKRIIFFLHKKMLGSGSMPVYFPCGHKMATVVFSISQLEPRSRSREMDGLWDKILAMKSEHLSSKPRHPQKGWIWWPMSVI